MRNNLLLKAHMENMNKTADQKQNAAFFSARDQDLSVGLFRVLLVSNLYPSASRLEDENAAFQGQ